MTWMRRTCETVREEPRFWVPISFLGVSTLLLVLALRAFGDEGSVFGWLGLGSAFLTAGLVDLFGLREGRRRRQEAETRLLPIRAVITRDLQWQRRDILTTVSTLFPVQGEPSEWEAQLRANAWLISPGDQANVYPPRSKADYLSGVVFQMQARQEHLEAMAATGMFTESVAAMSGIVLRSNWSAVLKTLQIQVGKSMSGTAGSAADVMRDLLAIETP